MKENTAFCEICRKDISFFSESVLMKGILKDKEYEYTGIKSICNICGSEVYVPEFEDRNLKSIYEAYRYKNEIISLEKILEIPKKYNIGKRPLSLLLGWGELTFTRYCDGYIPTKQYSDTLQRIYEDPSFYMSLLEDNRDKLKSKSAFEKSSRVTAALIKKTDNAADKTDLVINYLLFRCEDITPLALQKALYYIQGFYKAFTDKYIFTEDCEAWVHGPVYRMIYNRYSQYRFDPIKSGAVFDGSSFTDMEKAIIDSVIQYICCYSGMVLEQFTHSELPWLKTRGDLPANVNSNHIISKKIIGEYFSAVKIKYNMLLPDDIENYISVMFARSNKCI